MRLDKYLKVSRLIKRRTIANEACDAGRVLINGIVKKVEEANCFFPIIDFVDVCFARFVMSFRKLWTRWSPL